MELSITGRNIKLTDALKDFTQKKLQRVGRRDHHISKIDVIFRIEKLTHTAEATAHLPGTELHAAAKALDLYAAIDELADKLSKLIIKHKEKQSSLNNKVPSVKMDDK
jgi:ribosome hibernation promoting factor